MRRDIVLFDRGCDRACIPFYYLVAFMATRLLDDDGCTNCVHSLTNVPSVYGSLEAYCA